MSATQPPVTKYELTVKIRGNTHDEIEGELLTLTRGGYLLDSDYGKRDAWNSTGGRHTSVMVHTNPEQTPEKYAEELNTWWNERKAARRRSDTTPSPQPGRKPPMTENQTTERDIPDDAGLTAHECPHHFDCDGIRCDPTVGDVPSSAPARVELETITDRAAIRDSADEREPERVCCDGGHANFPPLPDDPETTPEQRAGLDEVLAKVWPDPAPGATVAALDLDALHETICDKFTGMDEVQQAADALVTEVRSLRAKVAALQVAVSHSAESCADGPCEFHETEFRAESAEAKVAAVEALAVEWEALRDRLRAQNPVRKTGSSGLHRREANTLDVVAEQIRAALATGEGK